MIPKSISVCKLVQFLKMKLDSDPYLQNINVSGEISNFFVHKSNHIYFTLKDQSARIACVMFSSNAAKLDFKPKDGDKVIIKCSTSIFETAGQLQLYVKEMTIDGEGDLYAQFLALKEKLNNDGYFDNSHKKPIPQYPSKIAIISGKDSAAYADMIKTFESRWPFVEIFFYPSLVQGNGAANQITNILNNIDHLNYDSIIIARGGGSFEDLWAFNDEILAKTIYACKTPIICGIGHEIDFTIAEMVADFRASTPTACVMAACCDYKEVSTNINSTKNHMYNLLQNKLKVANNELFKIANSVFFTNPECLLTNSTLKLDYYRQKLIASSKIILDYQYKFENYRKLMQQLILNHYNRDVNHFRLNIEKLDAYSPLKILSRGYSLVYDNQKLLKDVKQVNINDDIDIRLDNGEIKAKVMEVKHYDI